MVEAAWSSTPLPFITMIVALQPSARIDMGPESVRVSVCLIMAKEAVALLCGQHQPDSPSWRMTNLKARLRTGGRCTRRSHRELAKPDFWDGPPSHPDLCLWYVLLWPFAAEDKSTTAILAQGAKMVLTILMTLHRTVGGRLWCFGEAYNTRKALSAGWG